MPVPESFRALAAKVNNWGRWGDDDERGTLNLITDDVRRRAAALVKTGKAFPLAIALSEDGPQLGFIPGRVNPTRTMHMINEPSFGDPTMFCSSDDAVTMGLQAGTHWDSLAHVSYDGRLYNGYDPATIDERGAAKGGIDKIGALVGRGVLLDVARANGVDRLEPGYSITGADLDAAAELARVTVEPGDIVLIRTGQMQLLHAGDKVGYTHPSPGPSIHCVEWFHAHDIAAAATDTLVFEAFPGDDPDFLLPVHLLDIVEMGLTQGQNWDLEALAVDCARDGVYAFFLGATPEPFVGGLGAPVAPVAIK
ncbi:MAG TPA: cyclase family protein [Acidimicrobiales bacterium]|nr:cyclase family protein [Acidimicrobiales bacterium]